MSPASPLLVSTYQIVCIFYLKALQILGWPKTFIQVSHKLFTKLKQSFGQCNILKQWLGPLVISVLQSNSPIYWSALHGNLFFLLVILPWIHEGIYIFFQTVLYRSKHISNEIQSKLRENEILPASFFIFFLNVCSLLELISNIKPNP